MLAEQIFSLVSTVAMAAWLLLAVLPRQRWVAETVTGVVAPALLAAVYVAIVLVEWGESSGGFSSLAEVALLFQN
ncbi:MAG: abscisic acid-deficient protein Aba4 family protein, partial [Bryobacterales bacterium]